MKIPTNPHQTYTSPKGRQFRVISVEKIPNTEKWIGRVEKWHWIATIKMLDNGEIKKIECDYNDNVIKINKYRE
jgi:hypothetical protein